MTLRAVMKSPGTTGRFTARFLGKAYTRWESRRNQARSGNSRELSGKTVEPLYDAPPSAASTTPSRRAPCALNLSSARTLALVPGQGPLAREYPGSQAVRIGVVSAGHPQVARAGRHAVSAR